MNLDLFVLAVVLAALIVAAYSKPGRKAIGGVTSKDRKGRTTLVIWPATKGKKGKRRR